MENANCLRVAQKYAKIAPVRDGHAPGDAKEAEVMDADGDGDANGDGDGDADAGGRYG